jgi:hypothetical protein
MSRSSGSSGSASASIDMSDEDSADEDSAIDMEEPKQVLHLYSLFDT